MKTLQDVCLANPLKIQIAKVQFECTSDYDHFAGRRDAKHYVIHPLSVAVKMWNHSLEYIEKYEQVHRYTNDGLMRVNAADIASKASEEMKNLIPNLEELIYNGLDKEAHDQIKKGEESRFIHSEIEHQTVRLVQVYVPAYHAEFAGQVIDVPAEGLWENPNY